LAVFTSATEFADGSLFEEICFYILIGWLAIFFLVFGSIAWRRYKNGKAPRGNLGITKLFVIPLIIFLTSAVITFIVLIVKDHFS